MNKYLIKSKQPNCKLCGLKMKDWNPFSNSHKHFECIRKEISEDFKNYFNDLFSSIKL